jgi:tetratricopeptide (TPR) repeat protein
MNARRISYQSWLVIGLAFSVPGVPTAAQTSHRKESRPPTQGMRTLADAKRAERFKKAIDVAIAADRWDEAITKAEELVALRARAQGPKHFETVNAEWRLKALRRVAAMPEEDRVAYRSARTLSERAGIFYARGKYAQAQPLYEKALEIKRRLAFYFEPDHGDFRVQRASGRSE